MTVTDRAAGRQRERVIQGKPDWLMGTSSWAKDVHTMRSRLFTTDRTRGAQGKHLETGTEAPQNDQGDSAAASTWPAKSAI
jgi:hypothetical protein